MRRRVFVSYRRSAGGEAADAVAGVLRPHHEVFFDRDPVSLPPGVSWPHELVGRVLAADTLLAVIAPGWLDELRRRNIVDGRWVPDRESTDWVRREIGYALRFGRRVIALLAGGATAPGRADLPDDLAELADRQLVVLPATEDLTAALAFLADADDPARKPVPAPLPELAGPPAAPAGMPDDENHPVGKRWNPKAEPDSPHAWDYKFRVHDPVVRDRMRVALLAAHHTGHLRDDFSLADIRRRGEHRKWLDSDLKEGMFVQASCLVTDGMATGTPTRVLLCVRDTYNIQNPAKLDGRNVKGESVLIATCLSAFGMHGTGHRPTAVLNDLAEFNPWAVFSRKLLLPDSVVDCRFLGVGFNLSKPHKEYIHLVWHVRTRECPEAMLVPAREEKHYDVPVWQTLDQLATYDFEKAPIDRLVAEKVFGLKLPWPTKGLPSAFCGFVPYAGVEGVSNNGGRPERWPRDTVPLDFLRIFQQRVHTGKLTPKKAWPVDLLAALAGVICEVAAAANVQVSVAQLSTAGAPPFDAGLRLEVRDEVGRPVGRYLVVAATSVEPKLTGELVRQARQLSQLDDGDAPLTALLVLHGVQSRDRFELQGAVSLHDPGRTPTHVVRVALGDASTRPTKRVAHAVVPCRRTPGGPADALLVTQSEDDELPRLPGGKIEDDESPLQAAVRELGEELGLKPEDVLDSEPLSADGIPTVEQSPSTGYLTEYRLYPFVVRVNPDALSGLLRRVRDPQPGDDCRVWAVSFDEWEQTALGYDPTYARQVSAALTPEARDAAAIDLG